MAKIAQFFVEGGVWMIPVGCVSFMVAAIAIERVIFLFFKVLINHPNKAPAPIVSFVFKSINIK